MYMYMCVCVYTYTYISLSLYIYIYTYIVISRGRRLVRRPVLPGHGPRYNVDLVAPALSVVQYVTL